MSRPIRSLWAVDNLDGLSRLAPRSVGLVYLDPPFNSGRSYEAILAPREAGRQHREQAFSDAWRWCEETSRLLDGLGNWLSQPTVQLVRDLVRALGTSDLAAYLVTMAPRLNEIHRVLGEQGSLYVHCDPAASHYLKILLDHVFGPENFRNEIVWKRTHAHSSSRRYGPVHDTILFYSKTPRYAWTTIFSQYRPAYLDQYFTHEDERGRYQLITCTAPGDRTGTRAHYEWRGKLPPPGRHWAWKIEQMEAFDREGRLVHSSTGTARLKRYVDDGAGVALQDLWTDINRLDAHSDERIGFETQKPVALLERIIAASTKPDDVVLDPFCGTGTTMVAAERAGRQWIGMDNSILACSLALSRLRQEVHLKNIALKGFPSDCSSALRLLEDEPMSFGLWGTSMLATLADRKAFNGKLAIGSGQLTVQGKRLQLFSWVPLQARVQGVIPTLPRGRLSKIGFVLKVDRSQRELCKWLGQRMDAPVHEIAIENLVDSKSLSRGLASDLLTFASAA